MLVSLEVDFSELLTVRTPQEALACHFAIKD
jgi:hypothetical protein